jgi:hypothetical protein
MKIGNKFLSFLLLSFSLTSFAQNDVQQDSTGLPGDDFSLDGALENFRRSASPEEFEKLLNSENNHVNNLDLNDDGEIDYIRVIDKAEGDTHALVLQAVVSESENQDIAVIELEKQGSESAVLQIVGDEDIYGEETILEPREEAPTQSATEVVVNVWSWPAVRHIYSPAYAVWVSPWSWGLRPVWWRPWRPVRWHTFYGYHAPYRRHYVVAHHHRVVRARRIYSPVRTTSVVVRTRHQPAVVRYRAAHPVVRTTTVERGNGRVKTTRTTTRRRR